VSQDDVDVIRHAVDLFNRMLEPDALARDADELASIWADEPEIVPLRAALEAGATYSGADAFTRFRQDSLEAWSELEIEIGEITGTGPRYLISGVLRGRGRESGAEFETQMWFVFEIRDARVTRAASHVDRESALADLG
jgi:ketosteroid isomerase-like protein